MAPNNSDWKSARAPLIATALLEWSGDASWPVSIYLVGTAVFTITSILPADETFQHDIDTMSHGDTAT